MVASPTPALWRRPWFIALAAAAGVLTAAALSMLATAPAPRAEGGAPWQIEARPDRVTALGVDLPGTTLADLERRFGPELVLALVQRGGRGDSLEAYLERHEAAGVLGKLVFEFDVDAARLQRWRDASPRHQRAGIDTLRHELSGDDRSAAGPVPVVRMVFIVQARLTADLLTQRFGPPAERVSLGDGAERWRWPDKGLEAARSADGTVVLSYEAPGRVRTAPAN